MSSCRSFIYAARRSSRVSPAGISGAADTVAGKKAMRNGAEVKEMKSLRFMCALSNCETFEKALPLHRNSKMFLENSKKRKINSDRIYMIILQDLHFRIGHAGGVEEVELNCQIQIPWAFLGTFGFNNGTAWVELSDTTIGRFVYADAVKRVKRQTGERAVEAKERR